MELPSKSNSTFVNLKLRRKLPNLNNMERFCIEEWLKISVDKCKKIIKGYGKHLLAMNGDEETSTNCLV